MTNLIESNGDPIRLLNGETEMIDPAALKLHEVNPRQGDVGALCVSFRENGFWGAVVVDRRDGRVLAGNHRVMAARQLGMRMIPVQYIETDGEIHALRVLLADNRHSDLATYDNNLLAELLQTVNADGGLLGTGYDGDDLDDLLAELGRDMEPEPAPDAETDRADELRQKWGVESGQLWQLGRHRLLCGDSTIAEDVGRLLDGNKPALMVTDPPYGVAYEGGVANKKKRKKIEGDESTDVFAPALELAGRFMANGAWYVWHAGKYAVPVYNAIEDSGYEVRALIVWNKLKAHYGAPSAHYCQKHEPCLYSVRGSAEFIGPSNETTVWDIEQPHRNEHHPTQKPLECMERPIRNHKGDVYEPFAGSGTTIVAAERQNRTCYAMEIDPGYVGVILERLSLMGLEPELLDA